MPANQSSNSGYFVTVHKDFSCTMYFVNENNNMILCYREKGMTLVDMFLFALVEQEDNMPVQLLETWACPEYSFIVTVEFFQHMDLH